MRSFTNEIKSENITDGFLRPKTKEKVKRETFGLFDIGIDLWMEKQKHTFDLNSFYNFFEIEFSSKTNGLEAQKDQENDI